MSATRFSGPDRPDEGAAFQLDVHCSDGLCTIWLKGELDLGDSDMVRQTLVSADASAVVVDLSHLAFVDATGIVALLTGRWHILHRGGTCIIRGASEFIHRMFGIVGLADLLDE